MGLWVGTAPLGYLNQKHMDKKCQVIIDELRAPVVKKMFEKVAYEKWSGRKVYNWLRFEANFYTRGNKPLTLSGVYRILSHTFYYGIFERPVKSDNWYQGKHEPIVSKELFDLVQDKISNHTLKETQKEFAFTKLMTCGLCGSGITADEKFKKQKNGNVHRYVYYKCTKVKDPHCKCGFINEEDLVEQLKGLLDNLEIQTIPMKDKISAEVKRFKKFEQMLLGVKTGITVADIDIRNYSKFILQEGSIEEKRELLGCMKTEILLRDKKVCLR
jgi:predicted metal-binding protein